MDELRETMKAWFYRLKGKGNWRRCPQCNNYFDLGDLELHFNHSEINY